MDRLFLRVGADAIIVTIFLASRPAILLIGPTASGKTGAGLRAGGSFPVDIVSVDSAQVYRGMDIGTAKPDAAMLAAPAPPNRSGESGRGLFGRALCADTRRDGTIKINGRVPLLTGGTDALYVRALLEGLSVMPAARRNAQIESEARSWAGPAVPEARPRWIQSPQRGSTQPIRNASACSRCIA